MGELLTADWESFTGDQAVEGLLKRYGFTSGQFAASA